MEKRYLDMAGTEAAAASTSSPPPDAALQAKTAIARKAADIIRSGQTIAIGSGTTTQALAQELQNRTDLLVITNALDIAGVLQDHRGIEIVVMGGTLRPEMHSLLGHLTELAAQTLHADALFMGITAISIEHGLMSDHTPEILTDRALRRMASQVVVLADSTKFQKSGPAYVFGLEDVDTIVTDAGIGADVVAELEAHNITVLIADTAEPIP
jgi:DeoR family transcriptional regulator of aga operon